MLQKLVLIAIAGGLGTLARYGLSGLVQQASKDALFPWGTFAVNAAGCLVFGLLWTVMDARISTGSETRTVILVGFMGAFTTFSTFIFDTGQLLENSQWLLALGNVALQNVVGLAALFVGLAIGRFI